MEGQSARLKINLTAREIEVEGSEAFVREYAEKFEDLLSTLTQSLGTVPGPEQGVVSEKAPPPSMGLPPTFGEYLHMFPSSITDLDKMLIAGYYAQSQDPENGFTTLGAHNLLKEQGIKLTNAADCVNKNKKAKKVFALAKGKFRVSKTGLEYIEGLLSKS